jgi:hypothetical protein
MFSAIARGVSVLTEREVDFIKQHTAVLGEDGEAAVSKIQDKARESGCQLADILRMVEDYCKDLGNRIMLKEPSCPLTWRRGVRQRGRPS